MYTLGLELQVMNIPKKFTKWNKKISRALIVANIALCEKQLKIWNLEFASPLRTGNFFFFISLHKVRIGGHSFRLGVMAKMLKFLVIAPKQKSKIMAGNLE